MEIKERLIEVLDNVGNSRGLVTADGLDDDIGIQIKYLDDYLAVLTLAELLKDDKIEINIKADETDRKIKYLLKLLKI